jgi:hypothetical protein
LIFKVTGQGHGVTFLGEKIRHALHWFILINPEDISENYHLQFLYARISEIIVAWLDETWTHHF